MSVEPYWMKHFGTTGPVGEAEQALAHELRVLDVKTADLTGQRGLIYKKIRAGRRADQSPIRKEA